MNFFNIFNIHKQAEFTKKQWTGQSHRIERHGQWDMQHYFFHNTV